MTLSLSKVLVAVIGVSVTVGVTSVPSDAHYKRDGQGDSATGQWYFTGSTYKDRPLVPSNRKDPVNIIFYGAGDSSPYTRARIEAHMDDDWNTSAVGGRSWKTDSEIWAPCKDNQYVGWFGYPGFDSDRSDWHGSTSLKVPIFAPPPAPPVPIGYKAGCFRQHHLRFWDDLEHRRVASSGTHAANDWVIAGAHHEKVIGKVCCFGHKVDRDWDRVRVEVVKAMGKHCTYRRWKYVPQADGVYQKYTNSGFLARISLKHHADGGCAGA